LKTDPEAREYAAMVQTKHLILGEKRSFVEVVDGTFNLPSNSWDHHDSMLAQTEKRTDLSCGT
jgi:hypothetical protein